MYSFYQDLFTDSRVRDAFSEQSFVARLLLFETALADTESELGIVPVEAASAIEATCRLENVDFEKLAERTTEVGFPVAPLLEQLSEKIGDEGRGFLHWGATTQDAMDTALALQIRDSSEILLGELDQLIQRLSSLADHNRTTVMVGRSQMLHASPISFGYKVAVWLDGLQSARQRLAQAAATASFVQLGGAVGTLSALGEATGQTVRTQLAEKLGLGDPAISWHTSRGRISDAVASLGILTAALAKIGLDVSLLSQSEVGELSVVSNPGHGVSSTMPQKRNLIEPQVMQVAAKAVRQFVTMTLDASVQDHERGTGAWQLEWLAVPQAFLLTSGSLKAANSLVASLEVNTDRMRTNLESSHGLIMAEAAMMRLAPMIGRTKAHELVSEAADTAMATGQSLLEVIQAREEIKKLEENENIDLSEIAPSNYLGSANAMIDAVTIKENYD